MTGKSGKRGMKMGILKIGLYEQDITPNGKVFIPGQFYKRVTDKVESRLKVEIFVCEKDEEQLIIASADLTGVTKELLEEVRKRVTGKDNTVDMNKIILSATHTHTAFGYVNNSLYTGISKFFPNDYKYISLEEDEEYLPFDECFDFLSESIANGIAEAWRRRDEAYIGEEFGRAVVGHSRRVVYSDGTAKMYGIADKATFAELESGNDSGIELLYVFDKSKKPIGVLANVSCPSQVLEHKTFMSADYWGKVRDFTKEKFGDDFVVVGLCGAAGCQSPRDMIRFVLPDTNDPNLIRDNPQKQRRTDPDMYDIDGAIEIGHRIADVINRKVDGAAERIHNDAVFLHDVIDCKLPLRRVTETDVNNAREGIKRYIERLPDKTFNDYDAAAVHIYSGIISRYELQDKRELVDTEIHIARIGDVAFASNPFELFLDYGNKIRARSVARQTFLIQLACDTNGYLPTEKAEKGSHYSAYVASGNVGHIGGQLLVDTTLETIKKQFSEDK